MTSLQIDDFDTVDNPLELVEDILIGRDLPFDRYESEELISESEIAWCNLRLWFSWRPELGALIFAAGFDHKIPRRDRTRIYPLVAKANEKLYAGHFEINEDEGRVCFRHTILLRDGMTLSEELLDDLFELAHHECERFYPAFQAVLWGNKPVDDAMREAIFDTWGEA